MTAWPPQDLPQVLDTKQAGGVIRAVPVPGRGGRRAEGDGRRRAARDPGRPAVRMPAGVRRLVMHAVPSPVSYVQSHLTAQEKLALAASPYPSTRGALRDDVLAAVVATRASVERTRTGWSSRRPSSRPCGTPCPRRSSTRCSRRCPRSPRSSPTRSALPTRPSSRRTPCAPAGAQRHAPAVGNAWCSRASSASGPRPPRRIRVYLQGIDARVQTALQNPGRDAGWMREVSVATDRYTDAGGTFPPWSSAHPESRHARWMLESSGSACSRRSSGRPRRSSLQRITKALAAARCDGAGVCRMIGTLDVGRPDCSRPPRARALYAELLSARLGREPLDDRDVRQGCQDDPGQEHLPRRGDRRPRRPRCVEHPRVHEQTGQSAGSPMGVIPPYSIPVSSTAWSIGREARLANVEQSLTTRLTSSFVDASTTHAACRVLVPAPARHDDAVRRRRRAGTRTPRRTPPCPRARGRSVPPRSARAGRSGSPTRAWATGIARKPGGDEGRGTVERRHAPTVGSLPPTESEVHTRKRAISAPGRSS